MEQEILQIFQNFDQIIFLNLKLIKICVKFGVLLKILLKNDV